MNSKRIYAAWAGVHFFLITVICLRGIFALVAADATILPSALNTCARSGEVVVKMLAFYIWREHPDVKKIRAIFGSVNMLGISEFEHGKRESFQPLFSYDFSLRKEENQSTPQ